MAGALPAGARVLDAGAGEGQYAHYFARQRYCGVDLAVGDAAWDYSRPRRARRSDGAALFAPAHFHAAINVVTLEHLPEPARALAEIARTLAPGGRLLLAAPHEWEVHQAPHDYFRYTRYGLQYLLEKAGFEPIEIRAVGGYFRLVARRLLNGLQFFTGGVALAGIHSRGDFAGSPGADPAVLWTRSTASATSQPDTSARPANGSSVPRIGKVSSWTE